MLPYRDSRITKVAIGIFFLIVAGYAYYELRGILYGPVITVSSKVTEVHDPFVSIAGSATRISSLSMNGKAVSVTQTGAFDEPYLLAPGLNRIVLEAKDKYGRSRRSLIQILYTPIGATSTPVTASSTVAH